MNLLPDDVRSTLPALYSQDDNPDPTVWVKFFTPDAQFTWYITEFDGKDLLFGLTVNGEEEELGYVSLTELTALRGGLGLPVERDLYFEPQPLSKVIRQ